MSTFLIRLVMLAGMAGISGAVSAQDVSGRISANLEKWRNEYAPEKVYVHPKLLKAAGKPGYQNHFCLSSSIIVASIQYIS
jgi:hypothetical protein